jgi:hypothetical protein
MLSKTHFLGVCKYELLYQVLNEGVFYYFAIEYISTFLINKILCKLSNIYGTVGILLFL